MAEPLLTAYRFLSLIRWTVFIAGRIFVWKGRLVGVDLKRLRRLAERARDGVLSQASYRPSLLKTCCPRTN